MKIPIITSMKNNREQSEILPTKNMSPSVETLAEWLGKIAAFLGVLAAVVAFSAWWFSEKANKLKDVALENFKRESALGISAANVRIAESMEKAAHANERAAFLEKDAATANLKLQELQNAQKWRTIGKLGNFSKILAGKKKGNAQIIYLKEDSEAYSLADSIQNELITAGWTAEPPIPGEKQTGRSGGPFELREGGMISSNFSYIAVLVNEELPAKPYDEDTALCGLLEAFQAVGLKPLLSIPHEGIRPPVGTIKIIVGARL